MSTGDKVAHPNPSTNIYASRLATLSAQCMRLAVCNRTTRAWSQIIAKETAGESDVVYKELTTNLIGRARIVPAGVVALTRAQEYGYAVISIG